MARDTSRIQNLTRAKTLNDSDVLPFGPGSGDRAKGIAWSDIKNILEIADLETIVEVAGNYQVLVADDFVVGTGLITITFPLLADSIKSFVVKNNGVSNITLNGGGESIEGGLTVTPGQARRFIPVIAGWIEVT